MKERISHFSSLFDFLEVDEIPLFSKVVEVVNVEEEAEEQKVVEEEKFSPILIQTPQPLLQTPPQSTHHLSNQQQQLKRKSSTLTVKKCLQNQQFKANKADNEVDLNF